jgi:hypothetical protein
MNYQEYEIRKRKLKIEYRIQKAEIKSYFVATIGCYSVSLKNFKYLANFILRKEYSL